MMQKTKEKQELQVPDHTYVQAMMGGTFGVRADAFVKKVLPKDVTIDDFYGYMPQNNYIFARNGSFWPAESIDKRLKPVMLTDAQGEPIRGEPKSGEELGKIKYIKASWWISKHRPVETMTWAPGQPRLLIDTIADEGGLHFDTGVQCYNLYRPPRIQGGDARKARPWLRHIFKLYGKDAKHMVRWFAHRVQRPEIKINHALVIIGDPGVGKDTLLEPVKYGIGAHNFGEVSPRQMQGDFNGYLRSVILRVNEVH
jgi:hypothetical protein